MAIWEDFLSHQIFREELNVGTVPMFKMLNVGTVSSFKLYNLGTVPTFKIHNGGTKVFFLILILWEKWMTTHDQ